MESQGRAHPAVGLFYATNTLADVDNRKVAGADLFYRTIRNFNSRLNPNRWARVGGRVVVWLYHVPSTMGFTRAAWQAAIRSRKKMVVLETWNEYLGATEIAPNRENGWREWLTTQHYTAIFHKQ